MMSFKTKKRQLTPPRHARPPDISDLRNPPRQPSRMKVVNEYDGKLATTFGKYSGAAIGHQSTTQRAGTPSDLEPPRPYTSFKNGVEKFSPWSAPAHHVAFHGSVPLEDLPPRAATAMSNMEPFKMQPSRNKKYSMDATPNRNRSTSLCADGQPKVMREAARGSDGRACTTPMVVFGYDKLDGHHRNKHARTVDGKPVSTFGGAPREKAADVGKGSMTKLHPGPGEYSLNSTLFKKTAGKKGLLGSGKPRGESLMTRSGLVGDVASTAPVSRAPSRAQLESRAQQRLVGHGDTATATDLNGTVGFNSTFGGASHMNGTINTSVGASNITPQFPSLLNSGPTISSTPAAAMYFSGEMNDDYLNATQGSTTLRSERSLNGSGDGRPLAHLPIQYGTSNTHNVQLREQEARRKRILRVPSTTPARSKK